LRFSVFFFPLDTNLIFVNPDNSQIWTTAIQMDYIATANGLLLSVHCATLISVMAQFKVGDVVVLKSGSPKMTVSALLDDNLIECMWFEGKNQQHGTFPSDTLKLYEEPQSRPTPQSRSGTGWMGN